MGYIEKLYSGDLFPLNRLSAQGEEYQVAFKKLVEAEQNLLNACPEVKVLFDLYQDAQIEVHNLSVKHEFVVGFKVGAAIAMEINEPLE